MSECGRSCPRCGGFLDITLEIHLEHTRCSVCGWESWATVFPSEELNLIRNSRKVNVFACWKGEAPDVGEIAALRHVCPAMRYRFLAGLIKDIGKQDRYFIGSFTSYAGVQMKEEAARFGLDLIIESESTG